MTKLNNSNCDKTQIVTKFKNSNCEKRKTAQTQIVTKLKNWKCDTTKEKKLCNNFKTKNVTTQKLKLQQN